MGSIGRWSLALARALTSSEAAWPIKLTIKASAGKTGVPSVPPRQAGPVRVLAGPSISGIERNGATKPLGLQSMVTERTHSNPLLRGVSSITFAVV